MSGNLAEFLKVLTIVVSWSTLILVGRHYMLSLDESEEEENEKGNVNVLLNEQSQIDKVNEEVIS